MTVEDQFTSTEFVMTDPDGVEVSFRLNHMEKGNLLVLECRTPSIDMPDFHYEFVHEYQLAALVKFLNVAAGQLKFPFKKDHQT